MDDKVRFTVKLVAQSNVSYDRSADYEYDRTEWAAMTSDERRKEIALAVRELIFEDIEGWAEFENKDDEPDDA